MPYHQFGFSVFNAEYIENGVVRIIIISHLQYRLHVTSIYFCALLLFLAPLFFLRRRYTQTHQMQVSRYFGIRFILRRSHILLFVCMSIASILVSKSHGLSLYCTTIKLQYTFSSYLQLDNFRFVLLCFFLRRTIHTFANCDNLM